MVVKFIQLNLARCRDATDELLELAVREGIGVALVQEPYVGAIGEVRMPAPIRVLQRRTDPDPVKAAIVVFDPAITLSELTQESSSCVSMGILKLSSQESLLASVYLEPQLETTVASARLQMVVLWLLRWLRGNVLWIR